MCLNLTGGYNVIDSNSKINRKFNNRVPIPAKILDVLYDHLIIKINTKKPGFELKLTKNQELIFKTSKYTLTFYFRAYDKEYVLLNLHNCEYWELLELLPYDLELFDNDRNLIDRFCQELQQSIQKFYPELFIFDPTLDQSSQIKLEETESNTTFDTDISVESDPQIKSNRIDLEAFRRWIDREKDRYGLIFSKEACVHRIDISAKLKLNEKSDKNLFESLVKGWKLKFDPSNGQATAFNMKNWGFSIVLRCNKNNNTASFRFRKRRRVTWNVIAEGLRKNAGFLSQDDFVRILELIQNQLDPGKMYIHRSHAAFPEDIVKRYFLGATVKIKDVYRDGRLEDVIVYFDMSDFAEFEGKGPAAQVNAIVDLVTNSVKAAHTVGIVDTKVDSLSNELGAVYSTVQDNGETLSMMQISNEIGFQEIRGYQNQIRNYQVGIKRYLKSYYQKLEESKTDIQGVIVALDKFDESFNQALESNVNGIISGQELLSQDILGSKKEIIEITEFRSAELKTEIKTGNKTIIEKLDEVKDEIIECVESNFTKSRANSKSSLALILRQIKNSQELSVKEIQNKLNIKRSTLYKYVKQLQDKKLILPGAADPDQNSPGRPSKKYKINLEKFKKLRKKVI